MLRKTILTIFALFVLISCVSRKYGRHFYNNSTSSHQFSTKEGMLPEPVLIASSSNQPIIDNARRTTVDLQSTESDGNALPIKEVSTFLKTKQVFVTDSLGNSKKEKKPPKRKLERAGAASFLFMIAAIVSAFSLVVLPAFIFAILSLLLGIKSLKTFRKEKSKWWGKGFGLATVIAMSVALTIFIIAMVNFMIHGFS